MPSFIGAAFALVVDFNPLFKLRCYILLLLFVCDSVCIDTVILVVMLLHFSPNVIRNGLYS